MFVILSDFGVAIRLRWAALAMAWNRFPHMVFKKTFFGGARRGDSGLFRAQVSPNFNDEI